MALFKSGNPTLSEKVFNTTEVVQYGESMTVRGTMNKFGFMAFMLIAAASATWHFSDQGKLSYMMPLMFTGMIGGFIVALVITFKRSWAPVLAPLYGLLEGLFLGAISAMLNAAFAEKYPGLVMQAVGLTMGVAVAMFLLYNFRVIRATERFRSVVFTATLGIAIFYLLTWILSLFGVQMEVMSITNGSWLGIGISLFVVIIAALNLIIDFDMIERGTASGAPKYMEWYCAFGLMVTIVWLYIEMLKLLSRLSSRD